MLFYTALFLVCVAISALAIWLYRWVFAARKSDRALLPGGKVARPAGGAGTIVARTSAAPKPWGWSASNGARRSPTAGGRYRRLRAATAGRRIEAGVNGVDRRTGTGATPAVGWPYREEPSTGPERQYRVVRKRSARQEGNRKLNKPWGW